LWYVCEVWTLYQSAQKILTVFERNILKKICGPVLANAQWRNRCNNEIYNLHKEMELTRSIRLRRLQ
jgi:hypothetical protein